MIIKLQWKKLFALVLTFSLLIVAFAQNPANGQQTPTHKERVNFVYLYGGTTQDYINQFQKTRGAIDYVSPNFFDLDGNGDLIVKVDTTLTTYMQGQGVKVVPFLSNHWDRPSAQLAISTPAKREKLANDLVEAVKTYKLDGVNIDLENLTYGDKDNLTAFTALLATQLKPLGKNISIAVGSVERHLTTGWKSAYDLKNLSNHVDYVFVMAYDQSWRGSPPGPVAALPWVEKQVQYMITQIPKDKFILGVPFYGRVWTNGEGGGGIWHPDTLKEVEGYQAAKVEWHEEHRVPFVKYTRPDGTHREIWFEDARSIKEKIALVNKYDLRGAGAWRLGQEDTSIWNDFSSWLQGRFFRDTLNHWAEKDILFLNGKGIVAGRDANNFAPDAPITRAEAVAILSRIFDWEISPSNPFSDVPPNYWAIRPILGAYQSGVVAGIDNQRFAPQQNLTRAQLSSILKRSFDLELTENQGRNFIDVPTNHWAARDIQILNSHGLLGGRTENTFVPEGNVTRAELAALVARIIRR